MTIVVGCALQSRDGLTRLSKAKPEHKALLGHMMYVAQDLAKKGKCAIQCALCWHVLHQGVHQGELCTVLCVVEIVFFHRFQH